MKILVDMNLSPVWAQVLQNNGWEAVHWSTVGNPQAKDTTLFAWARAHGYVVFTHDLDFGTLLALTHAEAPSVLQVRTQDVTPAGLGQLVFKALRQFQPQLEAGALLVVDEARSRVRILPLQATSFI